MYLQPATILQLLSGLTIAHAAISSDNLQFHRRHVHDISVRQPQEQSSASTLTTKTKHSRTSHTTTAAASTISTPAHRNYNVAVGLNGTTFTPSALKNITIGDAITFYFYPRNFSIIQSTFARPCVPLTSTDDQHSIFSGFYYETTSGISFNKFVINVTTTDPLWLYGYDGNAAEGGNLCQRGMAMVINPLPKAQANGETLKAYFKGANAVALDIAGAVVEKAPEKIWGGETLTLSAKQKSLWESKHPQGVPVDLTGSVDDSTNKTATFNDPSGSSGTKGSSGKTSQTQIATYRSGADRSIVIFSTALAGTVLSLTAGMFGLGL